MARELDERELTIEHLMNVVHSYTDPIRIEVIMADAWVTCKEAERMHDFVLTECYNGRDENERKRLLKYYKDVPVWNLTVWTDGMHRTDHGRTMYMGIEARCHYVDMREGWLAEKADRERERRRAYREKKKREQQEER